jgi:hypothetical protein
MKTLLFAAVAMTALSAGTAFAGEGGGNGGWQYVDPNTAPPGFYDKDLAYQHQQAIEAYLINRERPWEIAHVAKHGSVAQLATPPEG